MDDRPDDEVEGPPPIGLSSRNLAEMLGEALVDLRNRGQELDDETIMVVIAAAIEANNRQLYDDLQALGVLEEVDEDEIEDVEDDTP
jgi:hypothetical protein